jgi:nucleotide-binding universal stress UspA family protein
MAWQQPHSIGAANVFGTGMDLSFSSPDALASAAIAEVTRLVEDASEGGDVSTTCEAIEGHPAAVLLNVVNATDLMVVGSRGHGGFLGALLGSVSQHVVTHAGCPVIVIPGRGRSNSVGR